MSFEPPEWVFIWFWLRFERDPRVMDALPQQDVVPAMSMADYDRYHDEWTDAGAPRATRRKVLEAFGVSSPLTVVPDRNPLLEV